MEQQTAGVAIVGGGITGLSAAYKLQNLAAAAGISFPIYLIEKDHRLGGKVTTDIVDDFVIEGGPDSFLARKPQAANLAREVGLGDELVGTNPKTRVTYILHRGRLLPIPEGMALVAPTKFLPFAKSPLISPLGKARMLADLVLPRRASDTDESIAHFVRRRMGREALNSMVEPLLTGIYAGDADELSILATFPQLRELEDKYGSLMRGLLAQRKEAARIGANTRISTARTAPAPMTSERRGTTMFQTLRNGLQALIEQVTAKLTNVQVLTGVGVGAIEALPEGGYRLPLTNGADLWVEQVIVTAPAFAAADVLVKLSEPAAAILRGIPYVSVATVAFGYPKEAILQPLAGTGFVVPSAEGITLTACTYVTAKWPHASREDQVLLRSYLGQTGREVRGWSTDRIIETAKRELGAILPIGAEPNVVRVFHWEDAMPQYKVGHLQQMDRLVQLLSNYRGIHLAGSAYRGLGLPDCIKQGEQAAQNVLDSLKQRWR